jgi:hypothetical protein
MFVAGEVAQPIRVLETLVRQTGIVVEKVNVVFRTNVRRTVAQNVVQIHTVLPRSTVVSIMTSQPAPDWQLQIGARIWSQLQIQFQYGAGTTSL